MNEWMKLEAITIHTEERRSWWDSCRIAAARYHAKESVTWNDVPFPHNARYRPAQYADGTNQ